MHLTAQRRGRGRSTGPGDEGGDLGTERGSPNIEIPKKTIYKNITPENRAPGNSTGGVYEAGQAAGTTTHNMCCTKRGKWTPEEMTAHGRGYTHDNCHYWREAPAVGPTVAGVWRWDAETRSAAAKGRATDRGGWVLLTLVHTGMALRNGETVKGQVAIGQRLS